MKECDRTNTIHTFPRRLELEGSVKRNEIVGNNDENKELRTYLALQRWCSEVHENVRKRLR
jgi:hypothetical protein